MACPFDRATGLRRRVSILGVRGSVRSSRATAPNAPRNARRLHRGRVRPPVLSVAIAVHGQLVYAEAFGFADLEQHVPAMPSTTFRIGSISKPLTAAALGLLYQHGKLDLDAPVSRYVPSFPDKGPTVTVREVGGHLGGIRDCKPNEPESQTHYPSVDSSLSRFRDDSLVAPPGTRFVYSTYGFVLLSSVIGHAAGIPYLDFMRDSVFAVLGLTRTVPDEPSAIIPGRARWYDLQPDGAYRNSDFADLSDKWAGGGFLSMPTDLNDNDLFALVDAFIRPSMAKTRSGT